MILTNIACKIIITLLTNTVESDNASGCSMYRPGEMHLVLNHDCRPYTTPTERTVTTTITERFEVLFADPDSFLVEIETNKTGNYIIVPARKRITQDRIISTETKRYRRSAEWIEVKPEPPVTFNTNQFISLTNGWIPSVVTNTVPIASNILIWDARETAWITLTNPPAKSWWQKLFGK